MRLDSYKLEDSSRLALNIVVTFSIETFKAS